MIEETGRVVAVEGDHVWVETIRQTACKSCELKSGCGQQALAKAFGDKRMHLKLENTLQLHENECVVLGIPEDALLKGSMFVYLMPLVLLITGALVSEQVFAGGDVSTIAGGLAGLAGGFMLIRKQSASEDNIQQPVILRTVDPVVEMQHPAS